MKPRRRVLITVGPGLVAGRRHMTQRSLVTALDKCADLLVIPAGSYDFASGRVRAYRRMRGGRFEELGMIMPVADLWIIYSDGYYLDHRALGFAKRRDFFRAQLEFHQAPVDTGKVVRVVNEPHVEARTLKSWFAGLDPERFRIIPTRLFSTIDEVYAFRNERGAIVAKLDWGGGGGGARRLLNGADVRRFEEELAEHGDRDLGDYCFQPYLPGDEKRLWFVGGRFVAGRKSSGRATPWSGSAADYRVAAYDDQVDGFRADVTAAERLCRVSGLTVGSIDFIGDRINEINGCGTIFTEYRNWDCIVDARPALVKYFVDLVRGSRSSARAQRATTPV
ncbi:MAG TPA: hypothetical protein VFB75_05015 [Burkholderiales bacterium]|nr:hypothetical protein [Burkholderiales bacterium]